jgi:hypothetical protein
LRAPPNSVPRGRGVRGAARGLERDGKGFGATQEETAMTQLRPHATVD